MGFEMILGQESAKRFIQNSIEKDRVSHAYLFEGPSGIGKKTFAIEFAKLLTGDENIENSPDISLLHPDGASFKISQIRQMCHDIIIRPYGPKKVYILDESDKMTLQAQNSLLKSLEEPPSYSVIILLAKSSSMLLPTIISRCEKVKFSPLAPAHIQKYLVENKGISCERAHVLAAFSKGILSRALNLIESEDFGILREKSEKLIEVLLSGSAVDTISALSYIEKHKEQVDEIIDTSVAYFRDIMISLKCDGADMLINRDRKEFIETMAKKFSFFQISKIIEIMEESRLKLRSNCNFSITMQVMFVNIQEVIR